MKYSLLFLFCLVCITSNLAQQTVKGKVVDLESQFPLPGVNVQIADGDFSVGVATSVNGQIKLENVPLGRHQIRFTFIGYKPLVQTIVVNSGREVILNISIEESTEILEEFEITSNENREVNNEMAIISAQQFSVEETERYAGSRGDPARMASNLAGVQGADDSSLRTSLGFGLLWDTAIGPLSFYWADAISKESYDGLKRFQFAIGTRL